MQTKFFTADTHFDHKKILGLAARDVLFETVEQMNEGILDGINSTVRRGDILYILGDFCFKNAAYWRQKIRCKTVHFVLGNHDKPSYGKHFTSYCQHKDMRITDRSGDRHRCFLSHYPHCFWPASHYGSFHLYGHMHHQLEEFLDSVWSQRRSMDVGVDAAYMRFSEFRPFSEFEVVDILGTRIGHHDLSVERAYEEKFRRSLC